MSVLDHPKLRYLRDNVIGTDSAITTPFGSRRRIYFDYIASGLPFRPIEDLIAREVLPHMSNTHTSGSDSGKRMTSYVDRARDVVADALGASDGDVILFTGSGSTGAINHLIHAMGLRVHDGLMEACGCRTRVPVEFRPVIFRSRMEHHSNDISWRETLGEARFVGFDAEGRIDWRDLERQLALPEVAARPLKIGTFSAASNVTGIANDVDALAEVMHEARGYAFFDYAASAPYLPVRLHPEGGEGRRKDAVFISTHKFIGGPQTPGILAANRCLFSGSVPVDPGGGTVLYTSPWDHRYLSDIEHREEGGTPPIIQIIRAGLVFQLKEYIGTDLIEDAERELRARFEAGIAGNPRIRLLGNPGSRALGTYSMLLDDCLLDHSLAVRLLNDLYGLQVRSGCMCAGTYGHDLLGIDEGLSCTIRKALDQGDLWQKPGFVRISLSPCTDPEDVDVLTGALNALVDSWRDYEGMYERMPCGEYGWAGGGDYVDTPRPLLIDFPDCGTPARSGVRSEPE